MYRVPPKPRDEQPASKIRLLSLVCATFSIAFRISHHAKTSPTGKQSNAPWSSLLSNIARCYMVTAVHPATTVGAPFFRTRYTIFSYIPYIYSICSLLIPGVRSSLCLVPQRTESRSYYTCLLYTSPSPRDGLLSRMPSSA